LCGVVGLSKVQLLVRQQWHNVKENLESVNVELDKDILSEIDVVHFSLSKSCTLICMIYDQAEFEIRCEWGEQGVIQLAPISDVIIIVDVLSFSTSVEIATNKGAIIFPYQWKDKTAADYANSMKAKLASKERISNNGYSLSPASMINIPADTRLVLPSPNGATLTLGTGQTLTLTGCLRNCKQLLILLKTMAKKLRLFQQVKSGKMVVCVLLWKT
jgi:hypothetical protein